VCQWQIQASDYKNKTTLVSNSVLEITANTISGVSLYINTGTSLNTATNETAVSIYSSLVNDFSPNQTLYLIAVGIGASPSLNFTYRYY